MIIIHIFKKKEEEEEEEEEEEAIQLNQSIINLYTPQNNYISNDSLCTLKHIRTDMSYVYVEETCLEQTKCSCAQEC